MTWVMHPYPPPGAPPTTDAHRRARQAFRRRRPPAAEFKKMHPMGAERQGRGAAAHDFASMFFAPRTACRARLARPRRQTPIYARIKRQLYLQWRCPGRSSPGHLWRSTLMADIDACVVQACDPLKVVASLASLVATLRSRPATISTRPRSPPSGRTSSLPAARAVQRAIGGRPRRRRRSTCSSATLSTIGWSGAFMRTSAAASATRPNGALRSSPIRDKHGTTLRWRRRRSIRRRSALRGVSATLRRPSES